MRYIFFLTCCFLVLSGCNKTDAKHEELAVSNLEMPPPPPAGASESNTKDQDKNLASPEIPQKIIKQASLRFETNDLEKTFDQIKTAITANKGTILSDSEGKDYNSIFRNLTVKVPSQNFDPFLSSVSKGVSYFERKDISAEDVTEQYIDLNSRLKTKQNWKSVTFKFCKKQLKLVRF